MREVAPIIEPAMTLKDFTSKHKCKIMVSSTPGAWTIYYGPSDKLPEALHKRRLRQIHGSIGGKGATRLWISVNDEELRRLQHGLDIY